MKKISILGSTGSIGTQTLEVVENLKNIEVIALTTNTNIDLLMQQVVKFTPKLVCVMNEQKAREFEDLAKKNNLNIEVLTGLEGLITVATLSEVNLVINSVVGNIGLVPTLKAIEHKKDVALANKETLVTAGKIVMKQVKENGLNLYPIDSEHSAILQCLQGNSHNKIEKIILTASGGSFRDKTLEELENVTLEEALNHPNWSMGKKITIDSATLMNKGLEIIEAKWLFDVDVDDIDVVIHRQSIIHSMVQYEDGSIIAQMGEPDMKLPIQYAIMYPDRVKNNFKRFNFFENNTLTFEKPDTKRFPCLQYAYDSLKEGGIIPTIYNSSNEACVDLFLNGRIKFNDIHKIIYNAIDNYTNSNVKDFNIDDILHYDKLAREFVYKNYGKGENV